MLTGKFLRLASHWNTRSEKMAFVLRVRETSKSIASENEERVPLTGAVIQSSLPKPMDTEVFMDEMSGVLRKREKTGQCG